MIDPPNLPQKGEGPNRVAYVAAGVLLNGLGRLRRRRAWVLVASAGAGLLVPSAAVCYLLPDRYTSTAVMRITPPQIMENPLAVPPMISAAERLREMEPQVLSRENLGAMILTADVYRRERRREPLDEVADEMRARDLRKAQAMVRQIVTAFTERNVIEQRDKAQYISVAEPGGDRAGGFGVGVAGGGGRDVAAYCSSTS